jgi:hypothetical protein
MVRELLALHPITGKENDHGKDHRDQGAAGRECRLPLQAMHLQDLQLLK